MRFQWKWGRFGAVKAGGRDRNVIIPELLREALRPLQSREKFVGPAIGERKTLQRTMRRVVLTPRDAMRQRSLAAPWACRVDVLAPPSLRGAVK